MSLPTDDYPAGDLVAGRYRITRRLARGGMATVYLAVDERLDRPVAIKVLHPHLAEGPSGAAFISRFEREARAAARLSHPHLVAVHDQGRDGDATFLAMEYVDGPTLRQRMSANPPLTVADVLDIVDQVLAGLGEVHRAGLVHRDIKPENVLITSRGAVKLADFGLARAVSEVTAATTGTVLGTVAYLSPELVTRGQSDSRADVYAVGLMLDEMLTGVPAYTADTPLQLALRHVNEDVPRPSTTSPWLPTELDDLVLALAAREPAERPQDADAARVALGRTRRMLTPAALGHPVDRPHAQPDPAKTPEPADGPVAGSPTSDTTRALVVPPPETQDVADGPAPGTDQSHATTALVTQPTTALPVGATQQSSAPESQASAKPPRRRGRLWALLGVLILAAAGAAGFWWYQNEGPGAYTTVPTQITGLTQADAEDALTAAELQVTWQQDFSDTVAEGSVIAADPEPGTRVRKSSTVTVTVSQGVRMVTVPAGLVGASQDDASAALTAADLTVGDVTGEYYDDVPAGQVTAVSVPEGSVQPHGTAVGLTVSQGPAPVDVPDVRGVPLADATATLQSAGLAVVQGEGEYSQDVPEGSVVSQSPDAGASAHRKDTVTLVPSLGLPFVTVPDVRRMGVDDARATLEDLGLTVKVNEFWGSPTGLVISQDLTPGDEVREGTTITLTVV